MLMADRKPKRRRRPNSFVEIANALLGLLVLGLLVLGGLLYWGAQQFYGPGPVTADTTFIVERNSGLGSVATRLEEQGLIADSGPVGGRFLFQLGGYALKKQGQIKAGEFHIPAGASMADILHEITEGKPIQYAVTVPEGFTAWQVVNRLNEDVFLTGEISSLPPEGTVLPETYSYERGDTRASVLERMQKDMADRIAEIWADCDPEVCGPDKPIKTQDDLVTLASIVEKETGLASERDKVAAVFINRLKRGMKLQSDPTIIYGITKGEGPLGRQLRKSEIEAATDYNTYQIEGLPKGPIANPGVESLTAVAHPAKTADLYFVAAGADPGQGHLFAASYAQHQRNVAKYRAALREQANAQALEEAEAAKEALEAQQAEAVGEDVPAAETPATPAPAN
jgi:UPF0755 protein